MQTGCVVAFPFERRMRLSHKLLFDAVLQHTEVCLDYLEQGRIAAKGKDPAARAFRQASSALTISMAELVSLVCAVGSWTEGKISIEECKYYVELVRLRAPEQDRSLLQPSMIALLMTRDALFERAKRLRSFILQIDSCRPALG